MKNNLIEANELIKKIQNNLNNNKKNLIEACADLEDLIEYLQPQAKYHYMLFLAQIYASKLKEFRIAQTICRQIIQDRRPAVQLEGYLRLSFISALQHKYALAIKSLQQAHDLSEKKQQLQALFIDFCYRLFNFSKDANLLRGLRCESQQKYQQAIIFYNKQYQGEILPGRIENRYFAAKSIIQLVSIFPDQKFKGIDHDKCKIFIRELEEQRTQKDYQLKILDRLDTNYKAQKSYLIRIVQLLRTKQTHIRTGKGPTKGNSNKFYYDLCLKKIIAIYKLKKVLKTNKQLNAVLKQQVKKSLDQLRQNKVNNYNLLNEFTSSEFKFVSQLHEKIKINSQKIGFNKLKLSFERNTLSPRQRAPKRNRFAKYPSQDVSGPKGLKLPFSIQKQIETKDQSINLDDFQGSYMLKINQTTIGQQKRYFYYNKNQFDNGKLKLYYTKQPKKSPDNSYYDIRKIVNIIEGKNTKALQRDECSKFEQQKCFTIVYEKDKNKNFYVPLIKDYQKWIYLFKTYQQKIKMQSPVKTESSINEKFTKSNKSLLFF